MKTTLKTTKLVLGKETIATLRVKTNVQTGATVYFIPSNFPTCKGDTIQTTGGRPGSVGNDPNNPRANCTISGH